MLTKESIIGRVSSYAILSQYLKPYHSYERLGQGVLISNPFHPSGLEPCFNIFCSLPGHEWKYKDIVTAEEGDCFDLVQRLFKLSLVEALVKIGTDFNLNSEPAQGEIVSAPDTAVGESPTGDIIEPSKSQQGQEGIGDQQLNGVNNSTSIAPVFEFEKFGIGIDFIKDEVERLSYQGYLSKEYQGLFLVRTANRCIELAKNRDIPLMLFGEFWSEGELCILFAESGTGKSILAVQIGNSISSGKPIAGFKLGAPSQIVLYFDFELNDKMFEKRYSIEYQNHYTFDDYFYRIEINPDAPIPESQSFEDYLNSSLERSIVETGTKILIIDNLTYLSSETERAKDALPLMKQLKALKSKYGLSILALAHTPKRDLSKPITRNDLQGSRMLYNFCDSAFAIGESATDKGIRYLKQIKPRNTELIYDTENICICQLIKPANFLQFEFMGFGTEREHLKQFTEKDRENIIEKVKELSQLGKSQRFISSELHISLGAVNKYLKK